MSLATSARSVLVGVANAEDDADHAQPSPETPSSTLFLNQASAIDIAETGNIFRRVR
jgi:hypothetical protein